MNSVDLVELLDRVAAGLQLKAATSPDDVDRRLYRGLSEALLELGDLITDTVEDDGD